MNKVKFLFTKYVNSFKVKVENLEELSVLEIQQIQNFVKVRNGIFDFQTYTFTIQKRLEYDEFLLLIEHSDISAHCKENSIQAEVHDRIGFGQFKGAKYSELPTAYILWLKTNYRGYDKFKVDKELKKRNL